MIVARVSESENRVYVDVNGYISKKDAKDFLLKYKQITSGIRLSQYNLIVTPKFFECEDKSDIKTTCMAFLKSGYRRIYLLDESNSLMNTMSLSSIEKKLFLKSVKIINDISFVK